MLLPGRLSIPPSQKKRGGARARLGEHVARLEDGGVTPSRADYLRRMELIPIANSRASRKSDGPGWEECYSLQWVADSLRRARPDLSSEVSQLQRRYARPTVGDILKANKMILWLKS